jgi:hypothetical protein
MDGHCSRVGVMPSQIFEVPMTMIFHLFLALTSTWSERGEGRLAFSCCSCAGARAAGARRACGRSHSLKRVGDAAARLLVPPPQKVAAPPPLRHRHQR